MLVLLTDDDPDILATLADQLELQGIKADCAYNGEQALTYCEQQIYDVIVLDVMMPKRDGLSTCNELRTRGINTPILLLTARDTLEDKVAGFTSGADDYLVKPFAMQELLCRIHALSHRVSKLSQVLKVGGLELNPSLSQATRSGLPLKLNPIQFKLLATLMHHSPNVVSRGQLEHAIWPDEAPDSDALRSHLYQLRQIIDKPFTHPMLETVRGIGFRLVAPAVDQESSCSPI
jgi:DNA-binding response OmpR family regulator